MNPKWWLLFFIFSSAVLLGQGQALQQKYDFQLTAGSLFSCLDQLESLSDEFSLAYSADMIDASIHVASRRWTDAPISDILDTLLSDTDITYRWIGSTIVFSKKKHKRVKRIRLYGTVRDKDTQDFIPHAVLQCDGMVVRSDEYGQYSLSLSPGQKSINCSMLGYESSDLQVSVTRDMLQDIDLSFDNEIETVVVSTDTLSRASHHYEHYGYQYLQHLTQHTPGLGGTRDIMHTVRALPGVQSGSGGLGGHYVRGSANGENLYLLDGATIYYPYHAFGVASIFDPAFIRDVQFYKSGQRAKYGSRASSVMDVHVRQGPRDRWTTTATGSLETASLMAGGPVGSDASLLAYGRLSTKANIYDRIITNTILMDEYPEASFSDLLVKYAHQLSSRHHLSATYYDGGDHIRSDYSVYDDNDKEEDFLSDLRWRTGAVTAQLRSVLSPTTLMSMRAMRSSFDTRYEDLSTTFDMDGSIADEYYTTVGSSISDLGLSATLDHHTSRWGDIQIGWQSTRHKVIPHIEFLNSEQLRDIFGEESHTLEDIDAMSADEQIAYSHAFHVEQRLRQGAWSADVGLRLSAYSHDGSRYHHAQPRANITYSYGPTQRITASVSRMVQYLHLLPFSSVNLPRDVWHPSTRELRPESVWQYDIGWHLSAEGIDLDANVYYKRTDNLVAFNTQLGSAFFEDVAELFVQGSGQAHGFELNLSKKYGRLRGNVAYSYARSNRHIQGFNADQTYAFQFDRRHQLKMLGSYQIGPSLSAGSSIYLGSPYPKLFSNSTSLGIGIDQQDSSDLGTKNTQRGSAVFRLDLSLQYDVKTGPVRHMLKVGAYNITNSPDPILHLYGDSFDDSYPGFSVPFTPFVQYRISF